MALSTSVTHGSGSISARTIAAASPAATAVSATTRATRLSDVADPSLRQAWARSNERLAELETFQREPVDETDTGSQEILAGMDREHARHAHRRPDIDGAQPSMGVIRSDEGRMSLAGNVDVVGVAALSGEEAQVFPPAHRARYAECGGVIGRAVHRGEVIDRSTRSSSVPAWRIPLVVLQDNGCAGPQ